MSSMHRLLALPRLDLLLYHTLVDEPLFFSFGHDLVVFVRWNPCLQTVKRIVKAKLPDLHNLNDISDYVFG